MLVAHVWLVAIRRLECKAPSNQNVRYQYLPRSDAERVSGVLADITKSPILYTQGLMAYGVYKVLIQPSSNKSRSIDCAMCAQGMCSIEL